MHITPQEHEVLTFAKDYINHNQKKFGVGLITQAVISAKFGFTKQHANTIGISLQRRGFIKRDKGRSSCFWEIT